MRILFISDLHGRFYREFFSVAAKVNGLDGILIGGDITQGQFPKEQQTFIEESFVKAYNEFSDKLPILYIVPGNDDWKIVEEKLKELSRNKKIIVPLGSSFKFSEELDIVGYPYVPITPFGIKDYEKWEGSEEQYKKWGENIEVYEGNTGWRSDGVELRKVIFIRDKRTISEGKVEIISTEDNISRDLEIIAKYSNPKRTVYLFHAPPRGIFDETYDRRNVGSLAIADFIHTKRPYLTLHGHIHEGLERRTPHFSYFESTLTSCGQNSEDGFYYLDINIDYPKRPWIKREFIRV